MTLNQLAVKLQDTIEIIDSHGCLTGDCPHETQAECDSEMDKFLRSTQVELLKDLATPFVEQFFADAASRYANEHPKAVSKSFDFTCHDISVAFSEGGKAVALGMQIRL
jgi:hypothetical protein